MSCALPVKALDKNLRKIKRLDRALARKRETAKKEGSNFHGSKRNQETKLKKAKLWRHVSRMRKDHVEKVSTELVRSYGTTCVENLNVKGLLKNHCMAKAINDACWSSFVYKLGYKTKWYGRNFVKVDTFFPSSQTCSVCGAKNPEVKDLSVRSWVCPVCGAEHDRDINAARCIQAEGLRLLHEAQ